MTDFSSPPPEALLIEQRRQALPRRQSAVSKVAKKAGVSEGRWRQIAKGYQQVDKETRVKVIAPAETLARMAAAVGAAPEDLQQTGREDAAEELRVLRERCAVIITEAPHDDGRLIGPFADMPSATIWEILKEGSAELRRRMSGDESNGHRVNPNSPDL